MLVSQRRRMRLAAEFYWRYQRDKSRWKARHLMLREQCGVRRAAPRKAVRLSPAREIGDV